MHTRHTVDEYLQAEAAVLKALSSSAKGISAKEAKKRLAQDGPNELKECRKKSPLALFLGQFSSFIVWVLIGAVAISFLLGDYIESVVILIIIALNACIGFIQEYRAEKAIDALKHLSGLKAHVIRGGERMRIDSRELVRGDVILLEAGQKVPADARILEAVNLETQEAPLTGESTTVRKMTGVLKKKAAIAERNNTVFSGTIITKGRGRAVVTGTGMHTEIGHIATLIQHVEEQMTPLQMKLKRFAKNLGYGVMVIAAIVFGTSVWRGGDVLEMLETAVSLAVAAIPEGLPAIVALSLALGVQRMLRHNALVRKLPSVETLGSTTVICTDKTGTLTRDQMTVRALYTSGKTITVEGEGYDTAGSFSEQPGSDAKLLMKAGALCNDAQLSKEGGMHGDPTEAALLVVAAKAGLHKARLEREAKRIDELPFDSERKRMSTVQKEKDRRIMYTKGAPDVVLRLCDRMVKNGRITRLTAADRTHILRKNEEFAKDALRVLGLAYRPLGKNEKPAETRLIFIGLQAMRDPPREEVKSAIAACKSAGIKVTMITGDHKLTAMAIARELGITGKVVTGAELDRMENINRAVEDIAIYARVSPEHKLRIVKALRKNGHVTAMTGDGVNDAPALKEADIGIAMGKTGTDVSREAAEMVLTDDNFASIVGAVEEGRSIYDNIRKFVYFLLSSNIAEVMVIFLAILIGLPLPLVAIQILWMNLITDGLPALALGVEPKATGIMKRPPRPEQENIITKLTLLRMLFIGAVITAGVLSLFVAELRSNGWKWGDVISEGNPGYIYAITMAFTALVMFELFNALNARSETRMCFACFFTNKWLLYAIAISLVLQLSILYTPLNAAFSTVPLSFADWALIIAVASTVLVADAIYKAAAPRLIGETGQEHRH